LGRERYDVDIIEHNLESRERVRKAADEFFATRDYDPVPTDLTIEDEDDTEDS
jgi:hypothetical protein